MPLWLRDSLPLVFCGDALAVVPGIGVAVAFQAPPGAAGYVGELASRTARRLIERQRRRPIGYACGAIRSDLAAIALRDRMSTSSRHHCSVDTGGWLRA